MASDNCKWSVWWPGVVRVRREGGRGHLGNVIEPAKPPSHLSEPMGSCELCWGRVTLVNGAKMPVLPCTGWSPMHWESDEEKRVVG